MKTSKTLSLVWIVTLTVLLSMPGVSHALKRHPKGSDRTTGYWCFDCHNFNNNAQNAKWLRTEITLKAPKGGTVTVDYPEAGLFVKDTPPYDGPCQVCHTETNHYRSDGSGIDHFIGANCLRCHAHFEKNMFTWSLVGSQSHETHLAGFGGSATDPKGPAIQDCTVCHYPDDYTVFGPTGQTFEQTDVCDACHSPGGAFDGVDDLEVGAKPNWEKGIYKAGGNHLKEGKDNWCATCHDDGISVVAEVSAPNVMGDNVSYGYNVTGHGRNAANYVGCNGCHNIASRHMDGRARTYKAGSTMVKRSYVKGYRLNDDLIVPRDGEGAPTSFKLCNNCHLYTDVTDPAVTNFKDDTNSYSFHQNHLENYNTTLAWDSDWNGQADSAISCTACHNVHGSPTPVMTRHGELIGHVPALDFRWYEADGITQTTLRANSRMGVLVCDNPLNLEENGICWGCHPTIPPDPTLIEYYRTPADASTGPAVTVDAVSVTDLSNVPQDSFEVGKGIRVHATFTITGTLGSYNIASPRTKSQIYNTSEAEWVKYLANSDTLAPGTYEWTWDKTIPPEAEVGSDAEAQVQIRILDGPDGQILSKDKATTTFTIAEGSSQPPAPEVTVTVNEITTTDLDDIPQDTFAVGKSFRVHANFTVDGTAASYYVMSPRAKSEAHNTAGADWTKKLAYSDTLAPGTYEWTWDKTIPPEAEVGSDAEAQVQIKVLDGSDGQVLSKDKATTTFTIAEGSSQPPAPEVTVTVNEVTTTDLDDIPQDTFAVGKSFRVHVNFTVDGTAASYYVMSPRAKSEAHNTSGADWTKKLAYSDTLVPGTYQWTWDKTIPPEAEVGSDAEAQVQIRILDGPDGLILNKDKATATFTIAQ